MTSPIVRNRTVTIRDDSAHEASTQGLAFTPDLDLTQRIQDALTLQRWARKAAYKAQLRRRLELADKVHTPEELAAIEADQARRIKAMGAR